MGTFKTSQAIGNSPVLHLNLISMWFNKIESGEKKEEYRKISPYWQRIFTSNIKIKGKYYHPTDVIICFSNGYSKTRRQMFVKCLGVSQGHGNPMWGATDYSFILKLGEIIK